MKYDFAAIEKKWQDRWNETKAFRAVTGDTTRPKFYGLLCIGKIRIACKYYRKKIIAFFLSLLYHLVHVV